MSFQVYARQVRDERLTLGRRYSALRHAVECYSPIGFEAAWRFAACGNREGPFRVAASTMVDAIELLEEGRAARLVEMADFASRRKAQKRGPRPQADPVEVRYRIGRRWHGPRTHEAAKAAVATQHRSRRGRAPAIIEPVSSALDTVVDAYLRDDMGREDRTSLMRAGERVDALDRESWGRPDDWTSIADFKRIVDLMRYDVLPFVRRGWGGDADRTADIFWAARAGMTYLPDLHTFAETRWWIGEVVIPQSELWVAERHGRPVAFAALNGTWLDHLYVEPSARNLGMGEALLAEAMRRRRELHLHVFAQNTDARVFYARHGFAVVGEGDGSQNEEGLPDLHLAWRAP